VSLTIPFVGRREKPRKANRTETKLARAKEQLAAVREDNVKLLNRQAAADDFFAILLHEVTTTNAAWEHEKRMRGEAEEAAAQMRMDRDEWRDEALALRAQLAPYKAAEANAHRIDVPPMQRDTTAIEDQATGPIDVRTLREAADAGLLGPVTNPGHVHTH
jgi:chromosome segregation ATPase